MQTANAASGLHNPHQPQLPSWADVASCSMNSPTVRQYQLPRHLYVSAAAEVYEANEAQEAAAVTIQGQALAQASVAVLSKVLGNIMQNPADAKYR